MQALYRSFDVAFPEIQQQKQDAPHRGENPHQMLIFNVRTSCAVNPCRSQIVPIGASRATCCRRAPLDKLGAGNLCPAHRKAKLERSGGDV
jgi:hypothetical protein